MRQRHFLSQLLTLLCASLVAADSDDIILNQYMYCLRYYGSVTAELELPPSIPDYNYNGTIRCPTDLRLPRVSGAVLDICPPYDSLSSPDNPTTLSASLRLRSLGGELTPPIDYFELAPHLITNGSVSGPFQNDGKPAIIQHDTARSDSTFVPKWTINGTQASLIELPESDDRLQGVYFGCFYEDSDYYCGGSADEDEGGCWRDQQFLFNMRNPLNFTYRFDNNEAEVEIWAEMPYEMKSNINDGGMTKAYITFGGDRHLPSVVEYAFWNNAETDYEAETAYLEEHKGMRLVMGADELPVLSNDTDSAEWYAAGNGTYERQVDGVGSLARGREGMFAIAIAGVVAFALQ